MNNVISLIRVPGYTLISPDKLLRIACSSTNLAPDRLQRKFAKIIHSFPRLSVYGCRIGSDQTRSSL